MQTFNANDIDVAGTIAQIEDQIATYRAAGNEQSTATWTRRLAAFKAQHGVVDGPVADVQVVGAVTQYGDNDRLHITVTGEQAATVADFIVKTFYAGFCLTRSEVSVGSVLLTWLVDGHRGQRKIDGITSIDWSTHYCLTN